MGKGLWALVDINLVENLDTYIGAMLGYNIVSSKPDKYL